MLIDSVSNMSFLVDKYLVSSLFKLPALQKVIPHLQ